MLHPRYRVQGDPEVFAVADCLGLLWRFRCVITRCKTTIHAKTYKGILLGINFWFVLSESIYDENYFKCSSRTFSNALWFIIMFFAINTTIKSKRNFVSYMTMMLSIRPWWIRGLLTFGAGGHPSKTIRCSEGPRAAVFRLQFPVTWREIHTLHVLKSPICCSFQ
jgi:hypothetical protein